MRRLFVGGPNDGKRLTVPDDEHYAIVPVFSNPLASVYANADETMIDIQTHTYVLKRFRDESGTTHEVFFHNKVKDPMEALLKGYRYHRKPRYR